MTALLKNHASRRSRRVVAHVLTMAMLVSASACGEDAVTPSNRAQDQTEDEPGAVRGDGGVKRDAGDLDAAAKPSDRARDGAVAEPKQVDAGAEASASCKALAISRNKCGSCHGDQLAFGAPMSLTTAAHFQADAVLSAGEKVLPVVQERLHDTARPMPPKNAPLQLTSEELAQLDAWLAAGAPAPAASCEVAPVTGDAGTAPEVEWPADCEEKFQLLANDQGKPHSVGANFEGYHQFYFDVPWGAEPVHAVVFRPITDNARVLHHWILYQGESSFLAGWAPGKEAKVMPPDVGVYMPATGKMKLEIHYYNSGNAQAELDESGVEVCITRKPRKNTATTYPFVSSATAPAGQRHVSEYTCTVDSTQPVHLVTNAPHMHKLGVHAKLEIIRAGGGTEVVHDQDFDFHDQNDYSVDLLLNDGDKVKTTCVYKNDTTQNVSFGTSSDAEMCFNFSLYYPMCGMKCTGNNPLLELIQQSQGGGCPTTASGSGGFFGL